MATGIVGINVLEAEVQNRFDMPANTSLTRSLEVTLPACSSSAGNNFAHGF